MRGEYIFFTIGQLQSIKASHWTTLLYDVIFWCHECHHLIGQDIPRTKASFVVTQFRPWLEPLTDALHWGEWGDGGYHRRGPSVVSCWAIFYTNISLKGIHLPLMPLLLNFPTLGRERGARQDITRAIQRTIHTVVCQSISRSLVRCLLLDWITYIYDVYIVRDLKG